MGSTPVLKPSEVVGILRKLDFELVRQRGSHLQGRDIAPPLLRQIAKDIGMTMEDSLATAEPRRCP